MALGLQRKSLWQLHNQTHANIDAAAVIMPKAKFPDDPPSSRSSKKVFKSYAVQGSLDEACCNASLCRGLRQDLLIHLWAGPLLSAPAEAA